jgi:hypothetical protein
VFVHNVVRRAIRDYIRRHVIVRIIPDDAVAVGPSDGGGAPSSGGGDSPGAGSLPPPPPGTTGGGGSGGTGGAPPAPGGDGPGGGGNGGGTPTPTPTPPGSSPPSIDVPPAHAEVCVDDRCITVNTDDLPLHIPPIDLPKLSGRIGRR